jgi:nitrile hydratase accessory protein
MSAALATAPATFPTPWAARAFAIVNAIAESGWFELRDFQEALIANIKARESGGECIGDEAVYYDCWIQSLASLLRQKGVPKERLNLAEAEVRHRLLLLTHAHDQNHENEHRGHGHGHEDDGHRGAQPEPIFVESAR